MAVRPCYYLVFDDNTFQRIRKDSFYRIMLQHENEVHPEFRGQCVRYAEISIQYEGRRPITVKRASFSYILFDQNGRLDDRQWQRQAQYTVEHFPQPGEAANPHLAEARIAELHEQYDREFSWKPTPSLREQLYHAALHNKLSGGYLS